jgi:hypothetical protein
MIPPMVKNDFDPLHEREATRPPGSDRQVDDVVEQVDRENAEHHSCGRVHRHHEPAGRDEAQYRDENEDDSEYTRELLKRGRHSVHLLSRDARFAATTLVT